MLSEDLRFSDSANVIYERKTEQFETGSKIRIFVCALGGGRTHTWRILSPLPLPLGYEGHVRMGSLLSNFCSFCSLLKDLIEHWFGEFSSEGVLLAWMIRAKKSDFAIAIVKGDLYSM